MRSEYKVYSSIIFTVVICFLASIYWPSSLQAGMQTEEATGKIVRSHDRQNHATVNQFYVQNAILTTTAVILLQREGHADPLANETFQKRAREIETYFSTILRINESPDRTPASKDPEYIRKMINRLSYTLATDGNFILSKENDRISDWRQYNALLSIAERAMSEAIIRHGITGDTEDIVRDEFSRIVKHAEGFLETPRWAVLHNTWTQEELAFQLVKFGEYITDFDDMLDQSIANIRANNPGADSSRVNDHIQTHLTAFARQYGAAALNFYAGNIGDIDSPDSPMNAISECWGTVAYNAPEVVFQVEYDPGDDFDAMQILQQWWSNPVVPAK